MNFSNTLILRDKFKSSKQYLNEQLLFLNKTGRFEVTPEKIISKTNFRNNKSKNAALHLLYSLQNSNKSIYDSIPKNLDLNNVNYLNQIPEYKKLITGKVLEKNHTRCVCVVFMMKCPPSRKDGGKHTHALFFFLVRFFFFSFMNVSEKLLFSPKWGCS